MSKILRKSNGSILKIKYFVGHKLILHHYSIQNVKDEFKVKINKESITHFSHFISEKVKTDFRKIAGSILEQFRKMEAKTEWWFSCKKCVFKYVAMPFFV